eukprot:7196759-Prymnesium_polylepis.1
MATAIHFLVALLTTAPAAAWREAPQHGRRYAVGLAASVGAAAVVSPASAYDTVKPIKADFDALEKKRLERNAST